MPRRTLSARTAADAAHIAARFKERPGARVLFDELCAHMASLGPMQMVATKSRVSFLARTRFAWVPEAFVDGSIYVRWLVPHPLDDKRLRSRLMGSRWSHGLKIQRLEADVQAWLAEAYAWDVGNESEAPTPTAQPRKPQNPLKRPRSVDSAVSAARGGRRAA